MRSYFVTGTDTEIGKTMVAAALIQRLVDLGIKTAFMKPVAAGTYLAEDGSELNDDVERLSQTSNLRLPPHLTSPYLLRAAAAPHIAAALEGRPIVLSHIMDCYRQIATQAAAVVVEGVGGFRVPLTHLDDTSDLARQLGLPIVMVVGIRLGCINQALLTAEAIAARGLTLAGWVANQVQADMPHYDANVAAIAERLEAPLLGKVPRLSDTQPASVLQHLDFSRLPGWSGKRLH